jgi:argininosuccinate lyase
MGGPETGSFTSTTRFWRLASNATLRHLIYPDHTLLSLNKVMTKEKPWSGRFTEPTDAIVETFTASVFFDRRLYLYDIMGSIAHAQMLAHVGVLTKKERDAIVKGLKEIEAEIDADKFSWSVALEDVHMNIEARLIERIGEVGKKLHTGRSRNDQVATDLRLYLRDGIDVVSDAIAQLQTVILDPPSARRHAAGITHLQTAQPVTFGHHLLAYVEMAARDRGRFADARKRGNESPLGAAALAGTAFPLDRAMTAKALGFARPMANSLDAVSDRDSPLNSCHAALLMCIPLHVR